MIDKIEFQGVVTGIQPRIRLTRSFDQSSHSYLGYALRIQGVIDGLDATFTLGIGKASHEKNSIERGKYIQGLCVPVDNPLVESVSYYKVSQLTVEGRNPEGGPTTTPPPWYGVPASLDIYRERGARRLAVKTYDASCTSCIWGCCMAVEMIIDQWNPTHRKYRQETFCYGPKSCPLYRPGPARRVPGRRGMTWVEEVWVDEQATAHRQDDE